MRMWMVNPTKLCRQHLLGEHSEIHMLIASMNKGRSIQGFLDNHLVEPLHIHSRHDAIASEMESRGYNHGSPAGIIIINSEHIAGSPYVNPQQSLRELRKRCDECRVNLTRKQEAL